MREATKYVCEVCGTEYADKEEAEACEKNHKTIERVTPRYVAKRADHMGYPVVLTVVMSDGEVLAFRR